MSYNNDGRIMTLCKNQEIIILSEEVTNATKGIVTEIFDDESLQIELSSKEKYSAGKKVDLFSVAGSGVNFFSSVLKEADKTNLILEKPEIIRVIQRREYTRAEISKNILIEDDGKKIRAEITDISAGGMRLLSDTEMSDNKSYKTDISLDSNIYISCMFKPVRINYEKDKSKFSISGKFTLIKNIDRVTLIQFCMKKQSEMQSK